MSNNRSGGLHLHRPARAAVDKSMLAVEHLLNNLTPERVREFLNGSPDTQLPWLMNLTIRQVTEEYASICAETGARNLIEDLRNMSQRYEMAINVVPSSTSHVVRGLAYAAASEIGDDVSVDPKINVLADAVRARVTHGMRAFEDKAIRSVIDETHHQFQALRRVEQKLELTENAANAIGNSTYAVRVRHSMEIGSGIAAGAVFFAARYVANEQSNALVELLCIGLTIPTYCFVAQEVKHMPNSATLEEGLNHAGIAALVISGSFGAQVAIRKAAGYLSRNFFVMQTASTPPLAQDDNDLGYFYPSMTYP